MVAWWIVALIYVALTVGYELLRPKQEFDDPTPGSLGDFSFPTIGEGRVLPMIFGTVLHEAPMVAWYGDLVSTAITEEVKTGLFSSEDVTTGHRYYLGMQLVLCSGEIDDVVGLRFDGKSVGYSVSSIGGGKRLTVDAPELFGGEDQEGGIQGAFDLYFGTDGQDPNDYLEGAVPASLPAYRGVCYCVARRPYIGTSPYLKEIAFELKRCPNSLGLADNHHDINGDANPAAIIFDILTSPVGRNGLGISPGLIDRDNFKAIGDDLADEELGLSMIQDTSTSTKDFLLEILRHIDGIMFVEPSTGLLTLKLVRFDYTPGGLPTLDESNCTVKELTRPGWDQLKNRVRVTYIDRADDYSEKVAQCQDLASIEASDGEVSTIEISLKALTNSTNAQLAAAKGLMGLGYPLQAAQIDANRVAWEFRPGTVFKLNWPPLGITSLILRVTRLGSGNLTEGTIDLEAVEDIFAIDWTGYAAPPASGWDDPIGDVPDLTAYTATEAPYEMVKVYGEHAPDSQTVLVMAARGLGGMSSGFNCYPLAYPGPGWEPLTAFAFFTPTGVLESGINQQSTELHVTTGPDMDRIASAAFPDFAKGTNVVWIENGTGGDNDEFIAFQTVAQGSGKLILSDLARGCLDTQPRAFVAGRRVWFVSYGAGGLNCEAPAVSPAMQIIYQPYNTQGAAPFSTFIQRALEIYGSAANPARSDLVYCPTDLKFNGVSYPDDIDGEMTVSWEHRARTTPWSYSNSGAVGTTEYDVPMTYTVKVYGQSDTLIHTEILTTPTKSWTYDEADERAESGLGGNLNNHLRVTIETKKTADANNVARELLEWEFDRNPPY
jgi:hypothetical protein